MNTKRSIKRLGARVFGRLLSDTKRYIKRCSNGKGISSNEGSRKEKGSEGLGREGKSRLKRSGSKLVERRRKTVKTAFFRVVLRISSNRKRAGANDNAALTPLECTAVA